MGYRESNWSLPRDQQEIIERQNILTAPGPRHRVWVDVCAVDEYQGGGPAATIEPLKDHLDHYETRLANLFGRVQAATVGRACMTAKRPKRW